MPPFFAERNKVVICCSVADEQYVTPLLVHLRPFIHQVLLDVWDERRLAAPAWQEELQHTLRTAKIIFALTSPGFLEMPLMKSNALPPLLDEARQDGAQVFLVILRPTLFGDTTFAHLQVFNAGFKPVMALDLAEQYQLWERVAAQVRGLFNLPNAVKETATLALPEDAAGAPAPVSQGPASGFPKWYGEDGPTSAAGPAGESGDEGEITLSSRQFEQATSGPRNTNSYPYHLASRSPDPWPSAPGAAPGGAGEMAYGDPGPPGSGSLDPGGGAPPWAVTPTSVPWAERGIPQPPIQRQSGPPGSPSGGPRSVEQQGGMPGASGSALPPPSPLGAAGRAGPSSATGAAPSAFDALLEGKKERREPVESLRFTAYYPKEVGVETWNTLLVYTHIAGALSQVQADAARFKQELGERQREASSAAVRPMKRGAELTIVPNAPGVVFNPARVTFTWLEDWHQTPFRFQAKSDLAGTAVNAEIVVYAGPLILAVVKMPLLCEGRLPVEAGRVPEAQATGQAYQHIFTSYSHRDTQVVLACRNAYQSLGFDVLIDVDTLRAGEDFNQALMHMIEGADIFQLFWSRQSAESAYVRREWEYALAHSKGEGFIRPVYWELPLIPPPEALGRYHFKYIELPRLVEAVNVYTPPASVAVAAPPLAKAPTPVPLPVPVEPPRGVVCFRCETANAPESRVCAACGYGLTDQGGHDDRFVDPMGRPYYARFSFMNGALAGRHFRLHQEETTIGRVAENDVLIPEMTVSRHHAVLRFVDDHWVIEDQNSHNGTFVNGSQIVWPQAVKDGDQLRFGDAVVLFHVIS
jgi:hypothetical protein